MLCPDKGRSPYPSLVSLIIWSGIPSRIYDRNLGDWAAVISGCCFHFDVADSAICPGIHFDNSADSPFVADSIVVGHHDDIIDLYITPFLSLELGVRICSNASRRSLQFSAQILRGVAGFSCR